MADVEQYLDNYQDNIAEQTQASQAPGSSGPGKPSRPSRTAPPKGTAAAAPVPVKGGGDVEQYLPDTLSGGRIDPTGFMPTDTHAGSVFDTEGTNTNVDVSSYLPYMPSGVHTDNQIDKMRAEAQGWGEGTLRHVGNLVPNVAAGLLENLGYMGALATDWGDERDYNNSLTELANKMKNPFGEVYRENPEKTWDLGDAAWWSNNFWQLAESAGTFALMGAGIGSMFSKLANLAAVGRGSSLALRLAGQTATAASLAYAEGAMSGQRVFSETYNTQFQWGLDQGMDPMEAKERAKHLAANAASTTVQLNTVLNTGLNMTMLTPMFKTGDDIAQWFRRGAGRRAAGETAEAWATRLASANADPIVRRMLQGGSTLGKAGHLGLEAFQEGIEEMTNQFVENTGINNGKEGREHNFLSQFGELQNYFKETMNSEGALNFVLGAFGGVAHAVALDAMPLHRVAKLNADGSILTNDKGKPVYEFMTGHTRNAMQANNYYTSIVDAVKADVDWLNQKQTDLVKAQEAGDLLQVERIKRDLFTPASFRSIMNGMGDSWIGEFEQIASLDNKTTKTERLVPQIQELRAQQQEAIANGDQATSDDIDKRVLVLEKEIADNGDQTEATEAGYTKDKGDNSYVERAKNMIKDIREMNQLWIDTKARYQGTEEQATGFDQFIFHRMMTDHNMNRVLEDVRGEINSAEGRLSGPNNTNANPDSVFITSAMNYNAQVEANKSMQDNIDELNKAITNNDVAEMTRLVERMGSATNVTDLVAAAKETVDKAERKLEETREKADKLAQSLVELPQFQEFRDSDERKGKNLMENVEEYMARQTDKLVAVKDLTYKKAQYLHLQNETSMSERTTSYLQSTEGRREFMRQVKREGQKKAAEVFDRMYQDHIKQLKEQSAEQTRRAADIQAMRRDTARREARIIELWEINRDILEEIKRAKEEILNTDRGKLYKRLLLEDIHELEVRFEKNSAEAHYLRFGIPENTQNQAPVDPNLTPEQQAAENTQVDTPVTDAAETLVDYDQELANVISSLPKAIRAKVHEVTNNEITQGIQANMFDEGNSYQVPGDLFEAAIQANRMTPEQAARVIQATQAVIDSAFNYEEQVDNLEAEVEEAQAPAEEAPVEEAPAEEAAPPVVPVVDNSPEAQDAANAAENADEWDALENPTDLDNLVDEGQPVSENISQQSEDSSDDTDDAQEDAQEGAEEPVPPTRGPQSAAEIDAANEAENADEWDALENEGVVPSPAETEPLPGTEDMSDETEDTLPDSQPAPEVETGDADYREVNHAGTKAVDAVKINNTALPYEEVVVGNSRFLLTKSTQINPEYPRQLQVPNGLKDGAALRLEVDLSYEGTVNGTTEPGQVAPTSYANEEGMVTDLENVPIRIVDEATGDTLGYLPRVDWVTTQYPGATNYRNIVDELQMPDGTIVDNLATQVEALTKFREIVVANYHLGQTTSTTVAGKGPGMLIMSQRVSKDGKIVYNEGHTKDRLPDGKLQAGLAEMDADGTLVIKTGKNTTAERMDNIGNLQQWQPGFLVPAYDGSQKFAPIRMRQLNSTDIQTAVHVLNIFAGAQYPERQADVDKIFNTTGFDVTTPSGLRSFINQYITYTQKFRFSDTRLDVTEMQRRGIRGPIFHLDIGDNGKVKVGFSYSGRPPVELWIDVNTGRVNQQFVDLLTEGLSRRPRNMVYTNISQNIRGINDNSEFQEIYVNKNGKVTVRNHENYNAFIKANSFTAVDGTNRVGNQYIYTVNPQVTLSAVSAEESRANNEPEDMPIPADPATMPSPPEELSESDELNLDALFGDALILPRPINTVGIQEDSVELSLAELEKLYNFTPSEQRNGKSPRQAYSELVQQGIGQLAKGFNPFLNCN